MEDPTTLTRRAPADVDAEPIPDYPTTLDLRGHMVLIGQQLAALTETCERHAQATDRLARSLEAEVRTRRLVVVDTDGEERIATACSDTLSGLTISAPPRSQPSASGSVASVAISAAEAEGVDELGRPISSASINLEAEGEAGVAVTAEGLTGDFGVGRSPGPDQQIVDGRVETFSPAGDFYGGARLDHQGLTFERRNSGVTS